MRITFMITAKTRLANRSIERRYFWALLFLLNLFLLRVAGQLLVAVYHVPYLPPMEEWFSGAIPYPELLASQILIIFLYGKVCFEFARGKGGFVTPNKKLGSFLLCFGTIYLSVMLIRYVIRMELYPIERWTGGSIPIFFHWVLASFLLVLGRFHCLYSEAADTGNRSPRALHRWLFRMVVAMGIISWAGWQILPAALAYQHGLGCPQYAVREQRNVAVQMHDGITLRADIFHPQHLNKTATILVRAPLSKSFKNLFYVNMMATIWTEHGYTVVIQGTRGRFGSDGTFYPLRSEREDGIDTLQWLQAQPWFNGSIATWGGSAFGYTQWAIADQIAPGPTALYVYESSSDFYKMFYPGGAFSLYSALSWAINSYEREDLPNWPSEEMVSQAARGIPLLDADKRAVGKEIPFFRDWVRHNSKDSYWQNLDASTKIKNLKAPVLLMAGWYDAFLPAQLDDFAQLKSSAYSDVAKRSRLIIGPLTHAGNVVFPDGKSPEPFRPLSFAMSLPWFDEILKAPGSAFEPPIAPVKLFVMGKNEWRNEREWPLARTQYTPLYLCSNGHANGNTMRSNASINGKTNKNNGTLSLLKPSLDQPADSYCYNPTAPVPTCGGAMIGNGAGIACQEQIEQRADVLLYTTPELQQELEITGPVHVALYVSTSAPQTDFTAKLVDVHPDGSAFNICDGIIRRSYEERPSSLPHKNKGTPLVHEINLALWPTSMLFARGHRIRLEISSSNFPRFDRNTNSSAPNPTETRLANALQCVYHSAGCPSALILPVIPPATTQTFLIQDCLK